MRIYAVLLAIATVLCSWLLVSLRRHRRKRLQHARVLASKLALAENARAAQPLDVAGLKELELLVSHWLLWPPPGRPPAIPDPVDPELIVPQVNSTTTTVRQVPVPRRPVERALDEAPTAQAAAKVLGALEPGALAEALKDQGVRDGPDLLSRLEALPNNKDVAPVDNFLDRLRTIRAACVRVEAKGQQLRGTKQDLDDLDQKKNSNADDLLYATRVDLAAQLATLEQHAVKLRHMEKMLLLERLEGAKGLESPRAIGKMPPHLPMKEAERLNDTRRREAKAYTAKSPTVRFEDGFAGVERDKFGSPVLKKRPMSPFEEHFGPEIAKDEGDDASPRTLARCMTARAATRAQQLIIQHEAAKPDPVQVAKQDEEQSCSSIEEVFERFCGLYRLEHMTNTIFAKFCRDTKGVISKKSFPVPMIDMVL